ncbi:MAG: hypothetical protein ACJAS1_000282 [Oleiphilaceae bacterium]|jgi:hypothetical protein
MNVSQKSTVSVSEADIRHMFIAMLFAFVMGSLFTTFNEYGFGEKSVKIELNIVILHILTALALVVSSWINWTKSFYEIKIGGPRDYALLVIDVIVLFSYYLFIDSINKELSFLLKINLFIYFSYFIWDLIRYDKRIKDSCVSFIFVCIAAVLISIEKYYPGTFLLEYSILISVILYRYLKLLTSKQVKV